MKTPPDSALADAQGIIADLRSQLAERTASPVGADSAVTAAQLDAAAGVLRDEFDEGVEEAGQLQEECRRRREEAARAEKEAE